LGNRAKHRLKFRIVLLFHIFNLLPQILVGEPNLALNRSKSVKVHSLSDGATFSHALLSNLPSTLSMHAGLDEVAEMLGQNVRS
jgi:hypothetical protein